MIKKCAALLLLFLANLCASNEFTRFKGNLHLTCADSFPAFDTSIIAKIASNLGMEKMDKFNPEFKVAYRNAKHRLFIGYAEVKTDRRYLHPALRNLGDKCFTGEDSILLSGFRVYIPDSKRVKNNFFEFVISAYEQERNPSITNAEGNFLVLPEKPEGKVIQYSWISPGYAMKYVYDFNPFSTLNPVLQYSYHLIDAFAVANMIYGPVFGKSTKDKLLFPGFGLVLLAEVRLLASFELRKEVNRYNLIRTSPYRVPNTVKYHGCR